MGPMRLPIQQGVSRWSGWVVVVVSMEGGGGSCWAYDPVSVLATAILDDGEVYRQTDTWTLLRHYFHVPSSIGSVVVTSLPPCRGRNP